jgi:hypothetical protein
VEDIPPCGTNPQVLQAVSLDAESIAEAIVRLE